ncbi:hypothetical protein BN946_scf184348.g1 [Trametes cinnabarina]|uniref:CxC2-like cysteine cluster KDZ transposase-associated domain-containing protein n=1 Tax=Pycnoporus cinnabarinus TaxID=5643 RepID=A0A060SJJ7_PYCCI|nr:hypothetical protein BN946_scf184348.g1 [Trametes cinnabarina]
MSVRKTRGGRVFSPYNTISGDLDALSLVEDALRTSTQGLDAWELEPLTPLPSPTPTPPGSPHLAPLSPRNTVAPTTAAMLAPLVQGEAAPPTISPKVGELAAPTSGAYNSPEVREPGVPLAEGLATAAASHKKARARESKRARRAKKRLAEKDALEGKKTRSSLSKRASQVAQVKSSLQLSRLPIARRELKDEGYRVFEWDGSNWAIQRVAGFGSSMLSTYAPRIFHNMRERLQALYARHPSLQRNFANSIYPAVSFNFGPSTVCFPHTNAANDPVNWCHIFALGRFNPDAGGHLVLRDFRLAVRFPAGASHKDDGEPVHNAGAPLSPSPAELCVGTSAEAEQRNASLDAVPEPVEGVRGVQVVTKTRGKRYATSDEPLRSWLPFRDKYLDELLRLEGRGASGSTKTCLRCTADAATYRCRDCMGGELFCKACIVQRHAQLPLHRIQEWSGTYFKPRSLRELGMVVRPAHLDGKSCISLSTSVDVVVLHVNGVHTVRLEFCECSASKRRTQLLRLGWWPATPFEPKTAATMVLLRQFHLLNLQGKLPAYDFYRALELATDNIGLEHLPDRSSAFMLMVREWRHVVMAKRAGRGHDATGIGGFNPGELAVRCRACPEPGVNLPDGWELAKPADAREDIWLAPGAAHFIDHKPYAEFIAKYAATQEDMRTCSGFAALLNALTRKSKGLRSTGVVAVSCRHEMFRPNGMGDLQKGERYRNIDYVLASSLRGCTVKKIKDSFDIACEWSKGFFLRAKDLPEELRIGIPPEEWVFVVPKFHVAAHKEMCQANYSSNYTPEVGRWDGEQVERLWSQMNAAGPSTKEMTPGARWEALDDFCNFNNWRKTTQFGNDLLRLQLEAIPEAGKHLEDFEAFDGFLRAQRPSDVVQWEAMVREWEQDHQKPNPYVQPRASQAGSPSAFIVLGLEVKQAQAALSRQKDSATTTLQQVNWQKRASPLLHKIQRYLELQAIYMPRLSRPTATPSLSLETATLFPITLPSDLPPSDRAASCDLNLSTIEEDLRSANAFEALEDLRRSLRMRASYNLDKIKNVTGQVPNTRAREKQATVDEAVRDAKQRYREARSALERLRGPGEWEKMLRPLLDSDVIALNERALRREELAENERLRELGSTVEDRGVPLTGAVQVGEGRRTLSWIWYTGGAQMSPQDDADISLRDALRVEWAKARARAARWCEQVRLVEEEMRRVIQSTREAAKRWNLLRSRRQSQPVTTSSWDEHLDEGLRAYADEHCAMEASVADELEAKWQAVRVRAREFVESLSTSSWSQGALHMAGVTQEPTVVIELEVDMSDEEADQDDGDAYEF